MTTEASAWDADGKPTRWTARLQFLPKGSTQPRRMQRSAPTKPKAESAVKKAALAFEPVVKSTDGTLQSNSPLSLLAERWFKRKKADGVVVRATLLAYRDQLNRHVIPSLGRKKISELRLEDVDDFLIRLAKTSRPQAVQSRACLSGMMAHARRYDLVPHNFMPAAYSIPKAKTVREEDVLDLDQVEAILQFIARYRSGPGVRGPRPDKRLQHLISIQFGAAMRIGETLALRKRDVILPTTPSESLRVNIFGTITEDRDTGKVERQPWTKSANGYRQIPVSDLAAEALSELLDTVGDADEDSLLFPNKDGGITRPNTMHRRWADVRKAMTEAGLLEQQRIVPHTFRKTMATALATGMGAEYTALYIGHGTSTATLFRHYVPRRVIVPDARPNVVPGFGTFPKSLS